MQNAFVKPDITIALWFSHKSRDESFCDLVRSRKVSGVHADSRHGPFISLKEIPVLFFKVTAFNFVTRLAKHASAGIDDLDERVVYKGDVTHHAPDGKGNDERKYHQHCRPLFPNMLLNSNRVYQDYSTFKGSLFRLEEGFRKRRDDIAVDIHAFVVDFVLDKKGIDIFAGAINGAVTTTLLESSSRFFCR